MLDLYVVRHGMAGQRGDPQWPDDTQRPLSSEGKQRFAEVVELLEKRGFQPGIVATSPMVRCRQTAELIAEGLKGSVEVIDREELLPGGDLETLVAWTAQVAREHAGIAWVGHAPDVEQITAALIDAPDGWIRFAKGAIAAVRFDNAPAVGQGELRWLVTAKLLGV